MATCTFALELTNVRWTNALPPVPGSSPVAGGRRAPPAARVSVGTELKLISMPVLRIRVIFFLLEPPVSVFISFLFLMAVSYFYTVLLETGTFLR